MNIFFLDEDLNRSAQHHVDKHVVKMRLELAQLACTAHHLSDSNYKDDIPYKKTHINHPSSIWTRSSISNYRYVVNLGLALCDELEYRFNTQNQKCKEVLLWLKNHEPNISNNQLTVPLLAMDNSFRIYEEKSDPINFAVTNYRNYYKNGKTHLFKWTNRQKPNWL